MAATSSMAAPNEEVADRSTSTKSPSPAGRETSSSSAYCARTRSIWASTSSASTSGMSTWTVRVVDGASASVGHRVIITSTSKPPSSRSRTSRTEGVTAGSRSTSPIAVPTRSGSASSTASARRESAPTIRSTIDRGALPGRKPLILSRCDSLRAAASLASSNSASSMCRVSSRSNGPASVTSLCTLRTPRRVVRDPGDGDDAGDPGRVADPVRAPRARRGRRSLPPRHGGSALMGVTDGIRTRDLLDHNQAL